MNYNDLILRSVGYISGKTQEKIRHTRILIAGCGIGSVFAETAVRLGYENFILVDHDTIDAHNLNRQNFTAADIGTHKVDAIKKRILSIYPDAKVETVCDKVTLENAASLVSKADLVFDTIDFMDLPGLIALHDACRDQNKIMITAVNAGFGAIAFYFPEHKKCTIRDLLDLPKRGSVAEFSYAEKYGNFVAKIADRLDPAVTKHFNEIMSELKHGKVCPASQVAPGGVAVAALAGTIMARIAAGLPVMEAPGMMMVNLNTVATTSA